MVSLLAGVVACEEPKEIGLTPTTPVGVLYTDTLTITRTTIQFDSVRSQSQSSILIGRYNDPQFGQVEAKGYAQLQLTNSFVVNDSNTTNATPASRIILDSTRMQVSLTSLPSINPGIYYGDTTAQHEIVVTRMADSLRQRNYDISTKVPVSNTVIARRKIQPRPSSVDSTVLIPVDQSLGRELLALANTNASLFSASTGLLTDPAGFRRLIPNDFEIRSVTSSQSSVLSVSPSGSGVILYYHVQGEQSRRSYIFTFTGHRFNQITSSRTGVLASLRPGQSLPATTTGRTYVQPATGITTKLQFPTLTNLIKSGRVAINRADLVITPTPPENSQVSLSPYMILSEVSEQNRLTRTDITSGGAFLFSVQLATSGPLNRQGSSYISPQVAFLDTRTNSYTFNLGGYLQSIVAGISPNAGLAILTPGFPYSAQGSYSLYTPLNTGGIRDDTQAYLTNRVWRMVLDGKASVKMVVFYTTSS
ncbi:DUF4270 family protein [Fibrella aquatilis]|uniref:DUF4270 family protein n=1 Tax=Fibrella aquatilis TaxID=2817059 RepID=A0A939G9Z6_9BACT|nr:DUF4270 family protein [Fibrella aquatilis]MBO0932807.1 DUF4270 family protein [Fibrella aquatilis]